MYLEYASEMRISRSISVMSGRFRLSTYSYESTFTNCDLYGMADVIQIHLVHCVDVLRQAIMCHGDTNILTWDFEPGLMGKPVANGTVMHSCRNFNSIYEWTKERQVYFEEISESAKNHTRDAGFDAYIPM